LQIASQYENGDIRSKGFKVMRVQSWRYSVNPGFSVLHSGETRRRIRKRCSGYYAGSISNQSGSPMTMQIEEVFPGVTVKAFIPGLKPSFSPNPFHRSLSFSSSGLTAWIPHTFTVTSEHIGFTFQFFCFTLFSCRFRAVD